MSYPELRRLAGQPRTHRLLGVAAAGLLAAGVISAAGVDGGGGLRPPITRAEGPPALSEPEPAGRGETAAPAVPAITGLPNTGQIAPMTNGHGAHRSGPVVLAASTSAAEDCDKPSAGARPAPSSSAPSEQAAPPGASSPGSGSPQSGAPGSEAPQSEPPAAEQEEPAPVAAVGAGDGDQGITVSVGTSEDTTGVQVGPVEAGNPPAAPDGVEVGAGGTGVSVP